MVSRRWGNSGALRRLGLKEEDIAKKMAPSSSDLEVEVDKQRKKRILFLFMPYKGFYVLERIAT